MKENNKCDCDCRHDYTEDYGDDCTEDYCGYCNTYFDDTEDDLTIVNLNGNLVVDQ